MRSLGSARGWAVAQTWKIWLASLRQMGESNYVLIPPLLFYGMKMADGEGFEPSVLLPAHTLSRRARSTAPAPILFDLSRASWHIPLGRPMKTRIAMEAYRRAIKTILFLHQWWKKCFRFCCSDYLHRELSGSRILPGVSGNSGCIDKQQQTIINKNS